jgi:16S rRNA (cytosine967-C5)-methyltransferase
MTPAARIAATIELCAAIDAAPTRPADAVGNDFFRTRRFIGSSDRRDIAERAWAILRARRRLCWWLRDDAPSARLLVGASLLLHGARPGLVTELFSGGRFAPPPLRPEETARLARLANHTLNHPAMPDAVRLEIPDWLESPLRERFADAFATELAAMDAEATLDLRVNLLKVTREDAIAALKAEGLEPTVTSHSPWGLRLHGRRPITSLPVFRDGLVEIQDEGSQLIAALVDARPGHRVVDWCAGAGGKTLALAMTMRNRGQLVACDVVASRLDGAVRRLRRAGVHNVERHLVEPGDKWRKRRTGSFDRVLVDAPCTGSGTWRRNPDARARLRPTDLEELVAKQAEILDQAATLTRAGGRLIYATCSLLPAENEAQVTGFLARHKNFTQVPLAAAWPFNTPLPCAGETLSLTPARHGTDGFFAAVLERGGQASSNQ